MVALLEIVALTPEQRTGVTRTRAVLIGSRNEALVAERLAVGSIVVVPVLVRDASVLAPSDSRVLARHRVLPLHLLRAFSDLPRVLRGAHNVASGLDGRSGGTSAACERRQCLVGYALVIQPIIFPMTVLPITPEIGI